VQAGAVPAVTVSDIERMREELFFEGSTQQRKLSRFWVLIILAIVLSITIGDRRNLSWSGALVVAGALIVIVIGWLVGHLSAVDVVAATNSQVAGRVSRFWSATNPPPEGSSQPACVMASTAAHTPPSTRMSQPVTKLASSETRNATTAASSLDSPSRPSGVISSMAAIAGWDSAS
jgi:hypothetical protein